MHAAEIDRQNRVCARLAHRSNSELHQEAHAFDKDRQHGQHHRRIYRAQCRDHKDLAQRPNGIADPAAPSPVVIAPTRLKLKIE